MTSRIARGERGVAAIEFAILLPVLLLIVVGTMEWGRYFVVRESVVHAAREGARGGTLLDATEDDARAAAAAFLGNVGIDGGTISVRMNDHIAGGSADIPAVGVTILVPFTAVTGLPVAVPQQIQVSAVMPSWRDGGP